MAVIANSVILFIYFILFFWEVWNNSLHFFFHLSMRSKKKKKKKKKYITVHIVKIVIKTRWVWIGFMAQQPL